MRKSLLGAVLALAAGGAGAGHDMPEQYGYIGLHGTQHFFDISGRVTNPDIEDTTLPGLQFGYRFDSKWSLQGWYEIAEYDNEDAPGGGDLTQGFLAVRHHYHDTNLLGFEPYTGLAVGDKEFDPDNLAADNETIAGPELGLQKKLGRRVALDLGTRATYSFDNERWDGQVYAGINVLFGKSGATMARKQDKADDLPPPGMTLKDSDNDGVPDTSDECPDTAAGAAVDSRGCEQVADADGDGVADSADQCPGTAANAKVDERGCHLVLEEDVRETLYVQFETGKAEVRQSSYGDIERVAELMRQYPESELVLEGHTDSAGPAELNRRLSKQRADAVKRVLVERFGIADGRIETLGKGQSEPVADNDTAEGRARNRRVETVLSASREVKQYQ